MVLTLRTDPQANTFESLPDLEWACGSVAGVEHRRRGSGRQDAWATRRGRRSLVAVVCDGCGSGARSEVGAEIGARLVAETVSRHLEAGASVADPALWQRARADVLAQLRVLAMAMGGSLTDTISQCLLFTVVGVAVTPVLTAVFAIGDGLIAVNREVRELGPYPDNRPPYLAYDLLDAGGETLFTLEALIATEELDAVVVATDGATELPGDIAALAGDDRLFRNRDALRRRLARLAEERFRADWDNRCLDREGGVLGDDTTVIVVRRAGAR